MSERDLFVEIGVSVDDDPLKDLDDIMNDVKEAFEGISDVDGLVDIKKDVVSVADEMDDLRKDTLDADRAVDKLDNNNLNGLENETKKSSSAMDILKKGILAVGMAIASYIAVDTIKDFAVGAIEAAAETQALEAQFEQVFDGIQTNAREALNAIAKETEILPSRLQGSFTKIAAFAKTTGMDTADALSLTERATLAAADSAAFYDRSIEDVIDNLQSFLKGSYENDAALGLSATEFTRNAAAMELYGEKFNDLTEHQKQFTLLHMVEQANELSGAVGQASRESEGFENVVGNLKQAWVDFQAQAGQEFLPHVITGIQWLTDKIVAFDPMPIVDGIFAIKDGFTTGYEAITNFVSTYDWLIAAIVGGVAAFYAISGAVAAYNAILLLAMGTGPLYTAITAAMTAVTTGFGAAVAFVTSPIFLIAAGIAAVVAISILLYRNWDIVKQKATELWQKLNDNPLGSFLLKLNPITAAAQFLYQNFDKVKAAFDRFKGAISNFKLPGWVSSIGGAIGGAVSKVTNLMGFSSGLGRVPYDEMPALLHKDEAVIQADEADVLRDAGILKGDGRNPEIDLTGNNDDGPTGGDEPKPMPISSGGGGTSISVGGISIQVMGGNTNEQTGEAIKAALDEYFADLGVVLGG